jgi:hypothetical protein
MQSWTHADRKPGFLTKTGFLSIYSGLIVKIILLNSIFLSEAETLDMGSQAGHGNQLKRVKEGEIKQK